MRYSLLSRFQGAWLGSSLGEALTPNNVSDRSNIVNYQPSPWLQQRNKIATAIVSQHQLSGALSLSDRQPLSPILLPLILLGHENPQVLQTTLHQFVQSEVIASDEAVSVIENVLLWGYAIALVLREKLDLARPIEQISAIAAAEGITVRQLQVVERAFKQQLASDKMVEMLARDDRERTAIALSLYCFATAPHDFYLAVSRARILSSARLSRLVVPLTATLSGAYNSLVGIPANWRMFGNRNQIYRQEQQTAVDLFNKWLGVYLPQKPTNKYNSTVVTTPKIIQPRLSLNIISQIDY